MRDKKSSLETLSLQLMKNFKIKVLITTRGSNGSMLVRRGQKPIYCPAFANKIVDKVGAGDAMLSIISLCIETKLPDDLTLYLGSLAGASSVENIGNSQFIDKNNLLRQVEYAIK
jgi:bifunctional ADP-heptose synthase (sugar kinase/adenylyltransferase)